MKYLLPMTLFVRPGFSHYKWGWHAKCKQSDVTTQASDWPLRTSSDWLIQKFPLSSRAKTKEFQLQCLFAIQIDLLLSVNMFHQTKCQYIALPRMENGTAFDTLKLLKTSVSFT